MCDDVMMNINCLCWLKKMSLRSGRQHRCGIRIQIGIKIRIRCLNWPSYTCKLKFYFLVPHTLTYTHLDTHSHTLAHPHQKAYKKVYLPWRSGNSQGTLSSAHSSYHFNSPCAQTKMFLPSILLVTGYWLLLLVVILVVVVLVVACHLMEFAAYALRMPGIILFTAAFRFLWNLSLLFRLSSIALCRVCFSFSVYFCF